MKDKPRISYSEVRGHSEVYPRFAVAKMLLFLVPGITRDSQHNSFEFQTSGIKSCVLVL